LGLGLGRGLGLGSGRVARRVERPLRVIALEQVERLGVPQAHLVRVRVRVRVRLPARGEKSGRHGRRSRAAGSRLRVPSSPWDRKQGGRRTQLSSTPTTTHYYYPLLLAYYYHPVVEHAYYYPSCASTTRGRARPTTTTTHYYYYPLLPTQLSRHEVTSRVMSKENCMSEIRLPCTSSMHIVW